MDKRNCRIQIVYEHRCICQKQKLLPQEILNDSLRRKEGILFDIDHNEKVHIIQQPNLMYITNHSFTSYDSPRIPTIDQE